MLIYKHFAVFLKNNTHEEVSSQLV